MIQAEVRAQITANLHRLLWTYGNVVIAVEADGFSHDDHLVIVRYTAWICQTECPLGQELLKEEGRVWVDPSAMDKWESYQGPLSDYQEKWEGHADALNIGVDDVPSGVIRDYFAWLESCDRLLPAFECMDECANEEEIDNYLQQHPQALREFIREAKARYR